MISVVHVFNTVDSGQQYTFTDFDNSILKGYIQATNDQYFADPLKKPNVTR